MVPEPGREPCGVCGEPLALAATTCPHCSASALVDVVLTALVTDGRKRYTVARAVSALGPPARPFPELQTSLAKPAGALATQATRAFAQRVDEALAPYELQADIVSRPGPASSARLMRIAVPAALVVLAVVALAWRRSSTAKPKPATAVAAAPLSIAVDRPAAVPVANLSGRQLASSVLGSAVAVRCTQSLGAGFFVAEDLVMTNAHVLCPPGDTMRVVLRGGESGTADIMKRDDRLDLAIVRVSGVRGQPIPLGDAGALRAGDRVVLVGSPVGMEFTYHEGVVSNPSRPMLGVSYIQVDARVNPGNSGGPLVDSSGRVVGVVSLKRSDAEGIGLALPINYAYAAETALIPPPSGEPSQFDTMRAGAAQADAEQVAQLAAVELKPMLVGAADDRYGRLLARVVLPSRTTPIPQSFSFHFRNGSQDICPLGGMVMEWHAIPASELSRAVGSRAGEWIQRNGLEAQLYGGEAAIPVANCRGVGVFGPDITLVLEGAREDASSLRLR
jgi:serine protease Do